MIGGWIVKRKLTVSENICLSNVVLVLVIVLLTGGICLRFTLSNKQQDLDATIHDVAGMVTQMDVVRRDLQHHLIPYPHFCTR